MKGDRFSLVRGCGGCDVEVDIGVGSDVAGLEGLGDLCWDRFHVHDGRGMVLGLRSVEEGCSEKNGRLYGCVWALRVTERHGQEHGIDVWNALLRNLAGMVVTACWELRYGASVLPGGEMR